ncbi:MAG: polyprenyl synthetase family protein [Hyphomicrobium sp.]
MDAGMRIEAALETALERIDIHNSPPKLAEAVRYAVFPGGARIRPRLCLAVARACGDDEPHVTDAALAAIEFMHCGSLVHDDLPAFDNAETRRGKPSVHAAFGESEAILVGDALIVVAFETLARVVATVPTRLPGLVLNLAKFSGMSTGIVAGQAWECEPSVSLENYHRAKTGSLFAAATCAGALAAGAQAEPWRLLGERIGEAYQVADDIQDMMADPQEWGKPCGQDALLGRPNALRELGLDGAVARLKQLLDAAIDSIPPCPGAAELRHAMRAEADRFLPKGLARRAA